MKKATLLLALLCPLLALAQSPATYYVHHKALQPNEYSKAKVPQSPYPFLKQAEAVKQLADSVQLYTTSEGTYVGKLRFKNGEEKDFSDIETGINSYYPTLGLVVMGSCNGDYTLDWQTGEYLDWRGNPQHDVISPSGKYRLSRITGDLDSFTLFEKQNGQYVLLGSLEFQQHSYQLKGIYWETDDELRYLAQRGEYWIPYSGKVSLAQ